MAPDSCRQRSLVSGLQGRPHPAKPGRWKGARCMARSPVRLIASRLPSAGTKRQHHHLPSAAQNRSPRGVRSGEIDPFSLDIGSGRPTFNHCRDPPIFLNLWPLFAPAPKILSAGTRGLLGEPKIYVGNPAALRLPPGFPADWPSGRSGMGRGKPQPTGVRQAFPCRPRDDSGDPRESPGLCSSPFTTAP